MSKDLRINEDIRVREVRLVGEDAEQLGVMTARDALNIALEKGLDLVEVSPTARPPVCKIMDYGKFKFEQGKKEKRARQNQKVITVKEVKFRLSIEEHDFQTKARNAERFLKQGDKVKVTIMFRGREVTHSNLGKDICLKLAKQLEDLAKVERPPLVDGRNMIMVLTPKQEA